MEVENMSSCCSTKEEEGSEGDEGPLPGFRFHPTDEELVGFYLRRKVEKRPIRLDLIKLVDIYKYDPWDLPKGKCSAGEKEWYFFCRRGRKYKNSVRPNRVTRSGFWKATGIDRPIYSPTRERECIGLKKSLVYYRGSAGKGTKTDWMMHEFRLPAAPISNPIPPHPQEAEVWTLCRILKRSVSYRKCVPDWREMAAAAAPKRSTEAGSESCSVESNGQSSYISFRAPSKPALNINVGSQQETTTTFFTSSHDQLQPPSAHAYPTYVYGDINDFLRHADWEDLRSVVDCASAATTNPSYF